MRSTKFAILAGVFVLALMHNVLVKADFSLNSYNSIEDCIKATDAQIVLQSDAQYSDARAGERIRVYTAPKAISYPTNSTQVSWLVQCSTKFNFPPVPRSGGHSSEGYSSLNNSVVIDLSYMDSVVVDSSSQTAQVGGGCRLGPLYIKLDQAGFTIVSGLHPSIGISGIIGAGGWGLQSRNNGITGDQVLSAEMVDANGTIINTSATEHPDLFWALRGGGCGTFGIVTSWKLKLIPAWTNVNVFHIGYPFQYAKQAITAWVSWAWKESDDMTAILTITHDGPPTDEHQFGVKIRGHYLGSQDELLSKVANSGIDNITGTSCVEYVCCTNLGSRAYFLGDDYNCSRTDLFNIGNNPYASVNYSLYVDSTIDNTSSIITSTTVTYDEEEAGKATSGVITDFSGGPGPLIIRELEKGKSMYFSDVLTSEQINTIVVLLETLPPGGYLQFEPYGGIFANQPNNMTAFSHRSDTAFHLLIDVPLTGDSSRDSVALDWIEKWETQVRPFSNGKSYVGYVDADMLNGATSNGATSNGATSNGTTSNGTTSNGTTSNGTTSNGATSNGTSSNPLSVYYGDNVPKLDVVKTTYDSKNIFTNSLSNTLGQPNASSTSTSTCPCTPGTQRLPKIRSNAAVSLQSHRAIYLMLFGTLLGIIMGI